MQREARTLPNFRSDAFRAGRAGRERPGKRMMARVLAVTLLAAGVTAGAAGMEGAAGMKGGAACAASPAPKSQAALRDGGTIGAVRYARLAIRLDGDAVTYWRNPGDAGAAPQSDFARSKNRPGRGAVSPAGTNRRGRRPGLRLPARGSLSHPRGAARQRQARGPGPEPRLRRLRPALPAGPRGAEARPGARTAPTSPGGSEMVEALAKIPRRLAPARPRTSHKVSSPGARTSRNGASLPPGAAQDVFVEAPRVFTVESRARTSGAFRLTLVEHPSQKTGAGRPLARHGRRARRRSEFDLTLPRN